MLGGETTNTNFSLWFDTIYRTRRNQANHYTQWSVFRHGLLDIFIIEIFGSLIMYLMEVIPEMFCGHYIRYLLIRVYISGLY